MGVAEALRQLSDSARSSLTDLSVSILPYPELMEILLDASPSITSLHVEIQTLTYGPRLSPRHYRTAEPHVSGAVMLQSHLDVSRIESHIILYIQFEQLDVKFSRNLFHTT